MVRTFSIEFKGFFCSIAEWSALRPGEPAYWWLSLELGVLFVSPFTVEPSTPLLLKILDEL